MAAVNAAAGSVMVTVAVVVHPPASVTVTVYVPAARFVAVAVVCTGMVFQLYVSGAVPTVGVTVADPVAPPKQSTFVCALMAAVNAAAGSVMVTVAVVVHPPASVTVTVYVPAARRAAEGVVGNGR